MSNAKRKARKRDGQKFVRTPKQSTPLNLRTEMLRKESAAGVQRVEKKWGAI